MQPPNKLEASASIGARWIALFGVLFLVGLSLATIADVLGRWLFNHPLHGVSDLYSLVMAIVVAAFFPITLLEQRHISIEFLGRFLGGRAHRWLNTLGALAMLVFLVLLSWQIAEYVYELYETGETTWILRWSKVPWWSIAAVMIVLCVPVQLIVLAREFVGSVRKARDDTDVTSGPSETH